MLDRNETSAHFLMQMLIFTWESYHLSETEEEQRAEFEMLLAWRNKIENTLSNCSRVFLERNPEGLLPITAALEKLQPFVDLRPRRQDTLADHLLAQILADIQMRSGARIDTVTICRKGYSALHQLILLKISSLIQSIAQEEAQEGTANSPEGRESSSSFSVCSEDQEVPRVLNRKRKAESQEPDLAEDRENHPSGGRQPGFRRS